MKPLCNLLPAVLKDITPGATERSEDGSELPNIQDQERPPAAPKNIQESYTTARRDPRTGQDCRTSKGKGWLLLPTGCWAQLRDLTRSSCFKSSKHGPRENVKRWLSCRSDAKIELRGPQPDQADNDNLMAVFKITGKCPLGERVKLIRWHILKERGLSDDAKSYRALDESLERLSNTFVYIETDRYTVGFKLIYSFERDSRTGYYWVVMDKRLKHVGQDNFAYIDIEQRKRIPNTNQLLKWFQCLVSSHEAGAWTTPIKFADLHNWSDQACLYKVFCYRFRKIIIEAKRREIICAYRIGKRGRFDTVRWERPSFRK